ncbi:MAG: hypothetical protein H6542_03320 [Lentimicrobiaceae bacterium]|nr:hypothetical protein [Lentimicrobiaceae bacterium]
MKKKYTPLIISIFLSLLLTNTLTLTSRAQNPIPNPDFEDWTDGEPDGWNSINQNILGTDFICITRDQTNAQSGTSSIKIETITENVFVVGPVTLPGIVSLGEIVLDVLNQTGTVEGGVPIDTQPQILNGYFRYQPAEGDVCLMGIGLFKWNGSSRDTIGFSYGIFSDTVNEWQAFALPIEYLMWEVPDTMNIMFFSSNILNSTIISGSKLWIDNLSLTYGPVSVQNQWPSEKPEITFHNTHTSLMAHNLPAGNGTFSLISLDGSVVKLENKSALSGRAEIKIGDMPAGIYIARYIAADGTQKTAKFMHR